jgi:hypothetical protein
MSMIGAIPTSLPPAPAQRAQVQPPKDNGRDEATESSAAKISEAASPNKVDITA